ncbi:universal stress protein [Elizabethkingia meningoseptica]|uniref:universal stress protein n=1 Tax=Elizabethkingia meningoseptica TaxID=238 RepID=UPI00389217D9
MKTIVLPIDFSERSEFLIDEAVKFAKEVNAKISLIHVAPLDIGFAIGDMGFQYFPEVEKSEIKEELLQLSRLEQRVTSQNIQCDHLLKQGDAASIILEYAEEKNADYLVIGSHGRSGMYDVFIGSLTKSITKKSTIPVLVIPIQQ